MPYQPESPDAMLLRDVVIDLLAGALHVQGEKSRVAHEAGMHLAALSRILGGRTMPRQKTAERIAAALPLPYHERTMWRTYVHEYWRVRRSDARRPHRTPPFDPHSATVLRIRYERVQFGANTENWETTSGHDPFLVAGSDSYERVHHDALRTIENITPDAGERGRHYTGLCTVLADASAVLGRRAEALHWARRSREAAQRLVTPRNDEVWRRFILEQQVNGLRAEAADLSRIGLHRHALDLCRQARLTEGFRHDAGYWSMQIARDELNALAHIARTPLADIDAVVVQSRRCAERSVNPILELLDMLLACAAASAYLEQDRPKQAFEMLRPWRTRFDAIPLCGTLHRCRFLTTWAHTRFACGDHEEALDTLDAARALADSAHLVEARAEVRAVEARIEATLPSHVHTLLTRHPLR